MLGIRFQHTNFGETQIFSPFQGLKGKIACDWWGGTRISGGETASTKAQLQITTGCTWEERIIQQIWTSGSTEWDKEKCSREGMRELDYTSTCYRINMQYGKYATWIILNDFRNTGDIWIIQSLHKEPDSISMASYLTWPRVRLKLNLLCLCG